MCLERAILIDGKDDGGKIGIILYDGKCLVKKALKKNEEKIC